MSRVQALRADLRRYHEEAATVLDGFEPDLRLPTTAISLSAPVPMGSVTALRESRLFLDGRDLGQGEQSLAALSRDLETLTRHWSELNPGGSEPLTHVFADRATPIAVLRPVLSTALRHARVSIAVVPASAPAPRPVPQGAADFKRRADAIADAEERGVLILQELVRRSSTCLSLHKCLWVVTGKPLEARADALRDCAASGLTDCSCDVPDLEGFEYILAYTFGASVVRRRSVELKFDPRAKRALELAADATLEMLVARVTTEPGRLNGEPFDIRLASGQQR